MGRGRRPRCDDLQGGRDGNGSQRQRAHGDLHGGAGHPAPHDVTITVTSDTAALKGAVSRIRLALEAT